jgi:iodotyrosine deiodinase
VQTCNPGTSSSSRIQTSKERSEFRLKRKNTTSIIIRRQKEWLDALAPLGTDEHKPYLEIAPYLIVVFAQSHGVNPDGHRVRHYYAQESVGIATGFLITALHHAGLVTLTHTPSPMGFLNKILDRPAHERPFLILVVGYPAEGARVPAITKKPLDEIATFL